jgi:hypothetical protein
MLNTVDLHLGTRILAEEDPVARLDIQFDQLAVIRGLSRPNGDNDPLRRFLLGGVGYDNSPPPPAASQ